MPRVWIYDSRRNPKYINILTPAIAFTLMIFSGTGFTVMDILNVIQEVVNQNDVRPPQPLASAVVASQIAISTATISAAVMYVVVDGMGVSFGTALMVTLPAELLGLGCSHSVRLLSQYRFLID